MKNKNINLKRQLKNNKMQYTQKQILINAICHKIKFKQEI